MTRRTTRTDGVQSPQRSAEHAYVASRTLGVDVRLSAPSRLHAERFERELGQAMLKLTRQQARMRRHDVKILGSVIARDYA